MIRVSRADFLSHCKGQIEKGIPIVGSGAGVGLSARCAEEGGVDMIIIYNSGRFRMAGRGSSSGRLPYSDANGVILEMAAEISAAVKHTPVIAGVYGSDMSRDMKGYLTSLAELGFSGVQNFPTVANLQLGIFGKNLIEAGLGFDREIEMVRLASEIGLITTPYCFEAEQGAQMAAAGADFIVAHMGLTSSGMIGADVVSGLDVCVDKIGEIARAAHKENPNALVICHGGPISTPEDAQYIFDKLPEVVGFYGASSAERLPTERKIVEAVGALKAIKKGAK